MSAIGSLNYRGSHFDLVSSCERYHNSKRRVAIVQHHLFREVRFVYLAL